MKDDPAAALRSDLMVHIINLAENGASCCRQTVTLVLAAHRGPTSRKLNPSVMVNTAAGEEFARYLAKAATPVLHAQNTFGHTRTVVDGKAVWVDRRSGQEQAPSGGLVVTIPETWAPAALTGVPALTRDCCAKTLWRVLLAITVDPFGSGSRPRPTVRAPHPVTVVSLLTALPSRDWARFTTERDGLQARDQRCSNMLLTWLDMDRSARLCADWNVVTPARPNRSKEQMTESNAQRSKAAGSRDIEFFSSAPLNPDFVARLSQFLALHGSDPGLTPAEVGQLISPPVAPEEAVLWLRYGRSVMEMRVLVELRQRMPEASLAELAAAHEPPLTKDAVAARLRRARKTIAALTGQQVEPVPPPRSAKTELRIVHSA